MTKLNSTLAVTLGAALLLFGAGAKADLITNGSFELGTGTGQIGYNTTVTGWTTSGYNFLFNGGTADTAGANGQYGNLTLWGANSAVENGGAHTGPDAGNTLGPSPDGGNFIGADGAYNVGAISQTINGLTAGAQYTVGFYWAGAQQYGYDGTTTEKWLVSLGGQTLSTNTVTDVTHGFTGWQQTFLTFTATGNSEVLSFLAQGTPNGEPPFSLLDGVTMNAVPEPASMTLLGTGLAALGFVRRRRQQKQA